MRKLHHVRLSPGDRNQLHGLLDTGCAPVRVLDRARMLLLADDELSDQQIADRVRVGAATVHRIRRRFAAAGLAAALFDRPHPGGPTKLDREQQALLLALNSDLPPNGAPRWTMQQLADTLISLGVVDEISGKTVGRVLKRAASES